METSKNLYVHVNSLSGIPSYFTEKIKPLLINDIARQNLDKALTFGKQQLFEAHIFILSYGELDIYLFHTKSRYTALKDVHFVNHDDYIKFQHLKK